MSRSPAPTHGQVMRQPRWIGALLLALLVAGGFAALAQWQMGHAVQLNTEEKFDSEAAIPLGELNPAGSPVGDQAAGRVATVSGIYVPGDFRVIENRVNGGETGAWVVGHLVTDTTPAGHLAVAIGWAEDTGAAERSLAHIDRQDPVVGKIEGRYMPAEGPVRPEPNEDPWVIRSILPGQLANLWTSVDGPVYSGFLVAHTPAAGLSEIDSVPPLPQETVNWLNLFYALEWVVFAGFALFFWYRITRDAWEKEIDQLAQDEEAAAAARIAGPTDTQQDPAWNSRTPSQP